MSDELEAPVLEGDIIVPDLKDDSGLTLRERNFLDSLFEEAGGDIRTAMDLAGFHHSVPISVITKKLNKFIKERSKEFLISKTARAVISLDKILLEPTTPGADTIIKATKEILDRGGVFKEEAVSVTEIRNMFILPAKEITQGDE